MRNFGAIAIVVVIVAAAMALAQRQLQPDHTRSPAQQVPTPTPTPPLGGTGYFFSSPGACPGTPLSSIPPQTSELQVNIVWDDISTDKARFHLIERGDRRAMPLLHNELLFERVGAELHRCATVTRGITYTTSGLSYFDHMLQAVDDQGGYIPVTPNPADMDAWSFDALETVEPVSTPTGSEYGSFGIEVLTAPLIYTRPDQAFGEPPVSQFSASDPVYLLQPAPCPADYVVFKITGPLGFYWEKGRGQFCRSYSGRPYEVGSSLDPGDYKAEAINQGFEGSPMYVWRFTVR